MNELSFRIRFFVTNIVVIDDIAYFLATAINYPIMAVKWKLVTDMKIRIALKLIIVRITGVVCIKLQIRILIFFF